MSLNITCTITIKEQKYELDSQDMEIFEVSHWAGSTGTFAWMDKTFLQDVVETVAEKAVEKAKAKLDVLKGDDAPHPKPKTK